MTRTTARRGLAALLTLACLAGALLVAGARPAPTRAPAFTLAAGGALTLQSDRHGVAILQAGGMRPGDGAEGTATLTASADAVLTLATETGAEQPGTGGALLSERLELALDDVTDPAHPVALYHGPLAQAKRVSLGLLAAGADRRFRFRVAFPRGAGDNALQGAALTARFVWTAVAAAPKATPTPTPVPPTPAPPDPPAVPAVPAPPAAPATPAVARVTGLPAARGCVKRRRYTVAAKPRAGVRVTGLQLYVDNRKAPAARKARRAKLDLKATRRSRVTVRVVVRTSAGAVTVSRAYRLCRR